MQYVALPPEIRYPSVAHAILDFLRERQNATRMNTIVKQLTSSETWSEKTIYETMDALLSTGLIQVVSNQPRFTDYALTKNGMELADQVRPTPPSVEELIEEMTNEVVEYRTLQIPPAQRTPEAKAGMRDEVRPRVYELVTGKKMRVPVLAAGDSGA
jgi:Fe2+ or Zn2+ uptake regulation protein